MSRKFSGLSKTACSVSEARCLETEYPNVSGMFPRGAHPTQIGDTERPVRPRGRLDEGSVTPFSAIDPPISEPSSTLCRTPRRLFGVAERLLDVLPQERLADALPDGVLHRGIARVLGGIRAASCASSSNPHLRSASEPADASARASPKESLRAGSVPNLASNACDSREVRKRSSSTAADRSRTVAGMAKVWELE